MSYPPADHLPPLPRVFACTCRFSRQDEFSPATLIEDTECGFHACARRAAALPEETPKFCSECGDDAEKPLGHGCANAKCPVLSASSPQKRTHALIEWVPCSEGGLWRCVKCDEHYASPPWTKDKVLEERCDMNKEPQS